MSLIYRVIYFEQIQASDLSKKNAITQPSAIIRYDAKSIFKWSVIGLNIKFSFSATRHLAKAK